LVSIARIIIHKKHKHVNNKLVRLQDNITGWDDLIALAKRHAIAAKVRQEELAAAIQVFASKRDAGITFPGVEAATSL
jgi:hypothetical protein